MRLALAMSVAFACSALVSASAAASAPVVTSPTIGGLADTVAALAEEPLIRPSEFLNPPMIPIVPPPPDVIRIRPQDYTRPDPGRGLLFGGDVEFASYIAPAADDPHRIFRMDPAGHDSDGTAPHDFVLDTAALEAIVDEAPTTAASSAPVRRVYLIEGNLWLTSAADVAFLVDDGCKVTFVVRGEIHIEGDVTADAGIADAIAFVSVARSADDADDGAPLEP